ncbi:hypothetical protein JCM5353_002159 [Sporobolomyces roseus]
MFSNYPLDRISLYTAIFSTLLGVLLSLWGLISTSSDDQVDFFPFFVILTGLWGILGFIEAAIYYLSRSLKQDETIFTSQKKSLLLHTVWFFGSFIFSIVLYSIWNSQKMFEDDEETFGLANGLLFAEIVLCALPQFFAFGPYFYNQYRQEHPSSSDNDDSKKSKHKKRKSSKSKKSSKSSNPNDSDGCATQDDLEKQPLAADGAYGEADYGMDDDLTGGSSKKKGKKGASTSMGDDAYGDETGTDDGMGDPTYGSTSGGGTGSDPYQDDLDSGGGGTTTDDPYASSSNSRGDGRQSRSKSGGGGDPYADPGYDQTSARDSYGQPSRNRDQREDGRSTTSRQQSSQRRSSASHVHDPSTIDVELHSRGSITRAEWDPSTNRYRRMSVSPEPQPSNYYDTQQARTSYAQPRQNIVPYQAPPPRSVSPPYPVSPTSYARNSPYPTSAYPVTYPTYPSYSAYPPVQSQPPYPTTRYLYQYSPPASPVYSPPTSPPPQQYAYPPPSTSQYSYGQSPYYR